MDLKRLATLRKAFPLGLLAAGLAFPTPGGAAPPEIETPSLVSPSLGCGAAPTSTALLGRVAAQRQQPQRRGRHQQAAPAPAAESLPSLAHAFYTCATMPLTAMPVGTGWLAVGPIRRS